LRAKSVLITGFTCREHHQPGWVVIFPTRTPPAISVSVVRSVSRNSTHRRRPGVLNGGGAGVRSGALVVDIGPIDQRERDGGLPGELIIDRQKPS